MAAFRRRTTFAAPFIVTVAASCSGKDAPSREADVAQWIVSMKNMKCYATPTPANPPAPEQAVPCPPGMSGRTQMQLVQRADKTCVVLPRKHITPCPLPPGQELVQPLGVIWEIEKRGADCHAEEEDACPPGVDCNPPKPRTFPCPPGVTEEKALRFAELPDATCVLVPDDCVDTACAKQPVACPPEYRD